MCVCLRLLLFSRVQQTRQERRFYTFWEYQPQHVWCTICQSTLYNNQINARVLIGQSAVGYCAGKPTEIRVSSELLYKSNRPQVSMGYITIIP